MDSPDYRLWVTLWRRTAKDHVVPDRCCCLHWTHQEIALDVCNNKRWLRGGKISVNMGKRRSCEDSNCHSCLLMDFFFFSVCPPFRLESNPMFLEYLCLSFNLPLSPLLKYTPDKPLNAFLPSPLYSHFEPEDATVF